MSDLKISELPALSGSDLASSDQLAVVDSSASQTSKLSVNDLIANGVTLISDDTIPGAKILFAAGDVPGTALADSAVTTAKIADDAVTAAKLANNSSVTLVTSLPTSGDFTGQLALDTDDNSLYAWDGSAWQNVAAQSTIAGSTAGEINIVVTTSGTTTTISATIDDTTAAAQFLAGPTGSAGTVGYRTIVSADLPTATSSAKGAVIVNGDGLALTGDTIGIDNTVSGSSTHHVVTYDVNGLITGGRAIAAADLPIATSSAVGGVIASDGLTVDVTGNLSIDNTVTAGTYTKVTVTNKGVVSTGDTLVAADIPDHSADKLTSGTIGTSLIANDAITADKIGDQATTKFGGAAGSDNVTIFPTGDFKGQFFYDETTQDLYIYTGSAFVPITVLSGNLVNAGAYNASTNQMSSVTSAGSSAGFSVGNALPAPAKTNLNHYVVVDTSGTGTGAAPAVALAPPDMLLSQGVGTEYSLIDVSNAIAGQTASNISLIASGDITATDVQAGITELDTEKLPKAGGTMTGNLELNNANVVFEGSSADDYETTLTATNPTADRTITLPNVTGTVVTTGDTGSVTSTMITDGTIVNADINASAEIAVSKLANGTARQLLETAADGTSVQFTSNIDIPGTLDVTGAATFDSTVTATGLISANGKIKVPDGTAAAPSLYFDNDTDTGIYSSDANAFTISTAGTARLTVDSFGSVGIGTIDPGSYNANGDNLVVQNSDGTGSAGMTIRAGTGAQSTIYFADGTSTSAAIRGYVQYAHNGDFLRLGTDANERLRIDASGNVGIGTTTPGNYLASAHQLVISDAASTGLTIATPSSSSGTIAFADGTGAADNARGLIRYGHSDNSLQFSTNATETMRIDSSGNVGIGFDTNLAGLCVNNTIRSQNSSSNISYIGFTGYTGDTTVGIMYSYMGGDGRNTGYLNFSTDDTERMRIDSSGNVGVGTSSPQQLLHLKPGVGQPIIYFDRVGGPGGYSELKAGTGFTFSQDSNELVRITDTGSVGIGTASPDFELDVNGDIGITEGNNLVFHDGAGTAAFRIRGDSANKLHFERASNNAHQMVIDDGKVGIGTTSPGANLHVESSGSTEIRSKSTGDNALVSINNSSLVPWILTQRSDTSNGFSFRYSGNNYVNIDTSGNVGIGTTSASFSNGSGLEIQRAGISTLRIEDSSGNGAVAEIFADDGNMSAVYDSRGNAANHGHQFRVNGSEKARIDSSGRLLLGTSSNQGGYLLQVKDGDISTTKLTGAAGGNAVQMLRFRVHNTSNTAQSASLAGISAETVSSWGGVLTFHTKPANGTPNESLTEHMRISQNGDIKLAMDDFGNGSVYQNNSDGGVYIDKSGGVKLQVARANGTPMAVNRMTNDGNLISFYQAGSFEGGISVSGSTVSYNGAHLSRWSQLPGNAQRTEILRGTVLSNIDEMCEWGDEDNEQLNRMKISDVEGDRNVSGVFQCWDDDDDTYTNDFYCAMTGDFVIRIAQGTTVARGDLLMSAGDGTAKPQDDDIIRSKTIAKVTSTHVSETYADGSYCVPCVLMAC